MMKSVVTIGLALGLLIFAPGEAAGSQCEAAVVERLDRLNVATSEIREIIYDTQRSAHKVVGILAWVSLRSCQGYVVVDMTPSCRVRQVYGRGECDLGGAIKTW